MRRTKDTVEEIKFRVALAEEQGEALQQRALEFQSYVKRAKKRLAKAKAQVATVNGSLT